MGAIGYINDLMRSIVFQRDTILKTFLLEILSVSLMRIVKGVILGLALSYRLWNWGGSAKSAPLVITLAAALSPSRNDSTLASTEVLRRVD